ncbi:MAG: hypothetical protein HON47_01775 [Candidatus Diapherotrites archaeon]|jgi:hypothetical protein|uniref:Uncharacterized protein n=1 Tax=Candidatus Iainarchaeum sp. TaxID=3101447 RepID=A0A8T5GF05_9ARCH|nr:hypothetical protein [Candidatus Diapherotrites archaeon]MBT7241409.1 hypothetical protein [Candidatus Diapherotrites archaeon]
MICFIALIVFAILALFSAKYRAYFKEALDCVFRKATLRKCTTSFDKKMKMKVTSKISKRNKKFGRVVYKNFDLITWIITIVSIIVMIYSLWFGALGVYNFYAYGNCNGPESNEFCVYDALAGTEVPNPNVTTISSCGELGECADNCTAPNYGECEGECSCGQATCEH